MPRTLYTQLLASEHNFLGSLTVDVPDGQTLIIRDVCAYCGAIELNAAFGIFVAGDILAINFTADVALSESFHWDGRLAIPGGSFFLVETTEVGWDFAITGYNLSAA